MSEFWEESFKDKQTMWGLEPSDSAISTAEYFSSIGIKDILIPGFGYGRNAQIFADNGMDVTGIEISKTAINLAKKHYGDRLKIYHGSVTDMPFDQNLYDGIFCYALIHLLDESSRLKLIDDCYKQLKSGGKMVFVAISRSTDAFGEGIKLSEGRYKTKHGVEIFYYDSASVQKEFGKYGLVDLKEISEPANSEKHKSSQKFWLISCGKSF